MQGADPSPPNPVHYESSLCTDPIPLYSEEEFTTGSTVKEIATAATLCKLSNGVLFYLMSITDVNDYFHVRVI